jgi:uncharacterized membrane protein YuzA (DUF378 family)
MERSTFTNWKLLGIDWVALVIMIIGALNWGLVGLFDFNLVAALFGEMTVISRIVYIIVALSAIWCIISLSTHTRHTTYGQPTVATH